MEGLCVVEMAARFACFELPAVPPRAASPWGERDPQAPAATGGQARRSLNRFGFVLPILVDAEGRVVAGWGLVLAARQLGLSEVPAVSLTDLSDADLRMLRLALNRITDDSAWDREALSLEFSDLLELEPPIDLEVSWLPDRRDRRSSWTAAASRRKTHIPGDPKMEPPR